jgi:Brp/Blh family beta-carotene 15,15'-monooxygenase
MSKNLKISVLTSFVGLWLTSYLSVEYQTVLGFFLILSFGVLHGANDLVLIDHLKTSKNLSFFKLTGIYVLIVGISVLLFTNFPILALLLFILVSSYHFGEQHWNEIFTTNKSLLTLFFQFNYGFLVLVLLFYFNSKEVIQIIFEISHYNILEIYIESLVLITLLVFALFSLRLYSISIEFKNNIVEQLFYLVVLAIVFKASSLIWGFTIYFIFWHSIPSLNDQLTFLYGSATGSNFKKYFKTAFIYWFVSLLGIFGLYYISKDMLVFDALFFAFLASITFPHFIVILNMYKRK